MKRIIKPFVYHSPHGVPRAELAEPCAEASAGAALLPQSAQSAEERGRPIVPSNSLSAVSEYYIVYHECFATKIHESFDTV